MKAIKISQRLLGAGCAVWMLGGAPAWGHGEHDPAEEEEVERLSPATRLQLLEVRRATRKYRDLQAALDDGYVDIGVFMPNMGYHYLKPELLDEKFEATKPELLVYSVDPCSLKTRLVAVEYAIPLSLSAQAPKGFKGDADVWAANTEFQLWTLHAWVWKHNPDGVFAAFNPDVP